MFWYQLYIVGSNFLAITIVLNFKSYLKFSWLWSASNSANPICLKKRYMYIFKFLYFNSVLGSKSRYISPNRLRLNRQYREILYHKVFYMNLFISCLNSVIFASFLCV